MARNVMPASLLRTVMRISWNLSSGSTVTGVRVSNADHEALRHNDQGHRAPAGLSERWPAGRIHMIGDGTPPRVSIRLRSRRIGYTLAITDPHIFDLQVVGDLFVVAARPCHYLIFDIAYPAHRHR